MGSGNIVVKNYVFLTHGEDSSCSSTDSWCHDDTWPRWTYNSVYQRKGHPHIFLEWRVLVVTWKKSVLSIRIDRIIPIKIHPMTFLRLMVFWKIRTGGKYSIATNFTWICLILKDSVCLILTKVSGTRITIHLDLSRSFIPLRRFFHSRRNPPLLTPSLVLFPERSV
jgi:hypothetical protein